MKLPERTAGEDLEAWIARLYELEMSPAGKAARRDEVAAGIVKARGEQRAQLVAMGAPLVAVTALEHLKKSPLIAAVRENPPRVLLALSAGVGAGKTVAACAAMLDVLQSGWESLFVRAIPFARWDRYDDDEMGRLLETRLLVIDDLGQEFMDAKGNFGVLLDEVTATRSENNLRTILTTNLGVGDFRTRYGERIASRISGLGGFFEYSGRDLRVKP